MKKYTFIAEYRGGTYISQYIALSLASSLVLWAKGLDEKIFSKNKKDKILLELDDPDLFPVPLKEVENVWCGSYLSGKFFLLLNIVETV